MIAVLSVNDKYAALTQENKALVQAEISKRLREQESKEKAVLGAANTQDGKAEQIAMAVSANIVPEPGQGGQELLSLLKQADRPRKLATEAVICSLGGPEEVRQRMERATRGELKRAIKQLRIAQTRIPEHWEKYEGAVSYISRELLHRL